MRFGNCLPLIYLLAAYDQLQTGVSRSCLDVISMQAAHSWMAISLHTICTRRVLTGQECCALVRLCGKTHVAPADTYRHFPIPYSFKNTTQTSEIPHSEIYNVRVGRLLCPHGASLKPCRCSCPCACSKLQAQSSYSLI